MEIVRHEHYKEGGRNRGRLHGVVIHDFVPRHDNLTVHHVGNYARFGGHITGPLYHWLIDHDGRIMQIADEGIKVNHAGRCRRDALEAMRLPGSYHGEGNIPIVSRSTRTRSGNYNTIAISLVRTGREPVTKPMWDALLWLCRDIKARNEPFDHRAFVGHLELAPGRKIDPNNFSLVQLRNAIVGIGVADRLAPAGLPNNPPTLRKGIESGHVLAVQRRLRDSWLLANDQVTGRFDRHTERAVIQYQLTSWLKGDGIVGASTWRALTPPDQR